MASISDVLSYRARMQPSIQAAISNSVSWNLNALRAADPSVSRPDVRTLMGLLEKAVEWDVPIETRLLAGFTQAVLDLMVAEGPGFDFRHHRTFLEATDAAIRIAHSKGGRVADLLLAQASYYAFIADGGPGRLSRIERAVELSG